MQKQIQEAKFDIKELLGVGFTILVLAIGMAYGLDVMGDIRDDMGETACETGFSFNASSKLCQNATGANTISPSSAEYNATVNGISGVAKIPEKIPTIATVVLAAVIIGILVTYLWARFAR